MIRQGGVSKKRAFTMDGDETESPSKCLRQESDDVLLKRLQDVVSERASLWNVGRPVSLPNEKAKNSSYVLLNDTRM